MSREEGIELAWYADTTETIAAITSSTRTTAYRSLKTIVDFIVRLLYEDSARSQCGTVSSFNHSCPFAVSTEITLGGFGNLVLTAIEHANHRTWKL